MVRGRIAPRGGQRSPARALRQGDALGSVADVIQFPEVLAVAQEAGAFLVLKRLRLNGRSQEEIRPTLGFLCAPAILAIPLPVRFGDEVIDASSYPPEVARELCRHLPAASIRQ